MMVFMNCRYPISGISGIWDIGYLENVISKSDLPDIMEKGPFNEPLDFWFGNLQLFSHFYGNDGHPVVV